ncbi:MAG TPA: tetratricopeptide repeat protein [Stellaceae bacterium]|nr:tetratricopeptide repeat protein [Stellaceae bacterium]
MPDASLRVEGPDALFQLGILAGQAGRLSDADRYLSQATALRPRAPTFHHALGLLRTAQRRFAEALACHDKALALDATYLGALVGRADMLHELGRLADAEEAYRSAAAGAPGVPEVLFGRATVLADLGRLDEAVKTYREVLALGRGSAEAHVNLGIVLRDLGRLEEAAAEFREALVLKPDIGHAVVELVAALCALGRSREAVDRANDAMRRDPQSPDACRAFAIAVTRVGPSDHGAETANFLERCFSRDDLEHDDLAKPSAALLRRKYGIEPSPAGAARQAVDGAIAAGGSAGCLADPLLLRLLAATVNTDLALEGFLTEVRRQLLLARDLPASLSPFLAAMALQSFNNGYVFAIDAEEEEARVAALRSKLEGALRRSVALEPIVEQNLLRFALYEPITGLADAKRLLDATISPTSPLKTVLAHCLADPLEEEELAREVPSLGAIENSVSRAVRDQYEAYPYPRWLSLPRVVPVSLPAILRRKFPHASLPPFLEGPIEILVTGCGTGRQPIATALAVAQARVLAVDLSLRSLGYARRMARRLGASTVSFLHADLLALGQLGREFAVVEAVGVLHHMEDPMAGWRVLCRRLRPGGLMRIGLYSALARAEVAAARERIADLGIGSTPREIRAFRQRVLFGDASSGLPGLALSKDMYDLNGCRDLLFHVREHRFNLLELREMLEALGLDFLGFELDNEAVFRRYRTSHPDDPAMTDLARWARFEESQPGIFQGMYVFWCQKNRRGRGEQC